MAVSFAMQDPIFSEADDRIEQALDVKAFNQRSVYNVPGYRPVRAELSHVPVRVSGRIPSDLEGVYLRNGTNTQFDDTHVRIHAFNGAGMLHQVQFKSGGATYSNTYIRTPRFLFEEKAGREVYLTFSDVAGGGKAALDKIQLIERKKQDGLIPDFSPLEASPASTAVQHHAGRIYCLQETGRPFVLHPRLADGRLVLDGTGHLEDWRGAADGPFSAHPRIDPETGDLHNLSIDEAGAIHYTRVAAGEVASNSSVYRQPADAPQMGYLHDYFLTENFVIFPDISIRRFNAWLLGNEGSCFRFDPEYKLRWGVVSRNPAAGDDIRWFQTDRPGSIWHVVNAWEERRADGGEQIVLYAPMFHSYPSDLPIHTPEEPPAKLNKWVLDLGSGTVTEDRTLLDHGYERPSLNLAYVGSKSRYAYLIDEEKDGYMGKGVLKYDLHSEKELAYFDYGEFHGGEALFVPKAGAVDEDNGYLLELLMAPTKAELIIIDAKTMTELARLHLPQRVPFGVHACWLDDQKVKAIVT